MPVHSRGFLLNNVAWTSAGPVLPGRVLELRARLQGEAHHLQVSSIDKFPRMTDYVIPEVVRIADADRVRLGEQAKTTYRGPVENGRMPVQTS